MERWMRRIIPFQFACRERDICRGGVSRDDKHDGSRYKDGEKASFRYATQQKKK
jgi:hypothetical protein